VDFPDEAGTATTTKSKYGSTSQLTISPAETEQRRGVKMSLPEINGKDVQDLGKNRVD
jgi:hypothetical protein